MHKLLLLLLSLLLTNCTKGFWSQSEKSEVEDVITGVRRTSLWPFSDSNLVRSVIWSTNWTVDQTKSEKRTMQCWYIRDFENLTEPDFKEEKSLFCDNKTRLLTATAVDASDTIKYFSQQKASRTVVTWLGVGTSTAVTAAACATSIVASPTTGGSTLLLAKGLCALVPSMAAGAIHFAEGDASWGTRPVNEYTRLTQFTKDDPSAYYRLSDNALGFFAEHLPKVPQTNITCQEALK